MRNLAKHAGVDATARHAHSDARALLAAWRFMMSQRSSRGRLVTSQSHLRVASARNLHIGTTSSRRKASNTSCRAMCTSSARNVRAESVLKDRAGGGREGHAPPEGSSSVPESLTCAHKLFCRTWKDAAAVWKVWSNSRNSRHDPHVHGNKLTYSSPDSYPPSSRPLNICAAMRRL